ncbi:MAG: hypothetical protein ABSC08_07590 [Bryobacteraceae bacterium]|jgi:hypothetical protein
MSDTVVCKYCGKPFLLQPGKPGLINECPSCREERLFENAKPQKSRREIALAASGGSQAEAKAVLERTVRDLRKTLQRLGCPDQDEEIIIDDYLDGPAVPSEADPSNHES